MQATRLLLRAALEDPLNQRFVFLSEACAPLIPAAALYAQLMSEPKSRINACSAPGANLNLDRCAEWAGRSLAGPLVGSSASWLYSKVDGSGLWVSMAWISCVAPGCIFGLHWFWFCPAAGGAVSRAVTDPTAPVGHEHLGGFF